MILLLFCTVSLILFSLRRLEQEEQSRQKIQLEKVACESKIKTLEETVAVQEDTNVKVLMMYLYSVQP